VSALIEPEGTWTWSQPTIAGTHTQLGREAACSHGIQRPTSHPATYPGACHRRLQQTGSSAGCSGGGMAPAGRHETFRRQAGAKKCGLACSCIPLCGC
jgi:hypothetical protein